MKLHKLLKLTKTIYNCTSDIIQFLSIQEVTSKRSLSFTDPKKRKLKQPKKTFEKLKRKRKEARNPFNDEHLRSYGKMEGTKVYLLLLKRFFFHN